MKGLFLLAVVAVALSGCATYKDPLIRLGKVGVAIGPSIKAEGPGEEARKEEFLKACREAAALGDE